MQIDSWIAGGGANGHDGHGRRCLGRPNPGSWGQVIRNTSRLRYLLATAALLGLAVAISLFFVGLWQYRQLQHVWHIGLWITGSLGLSVAMAAATGLLLIQRIHTRLRLLLRAAHHITHGDFTIALPPETCGDMGVLFRAFESMRMAVQERDQALRRFNDLLQDEVDSRTNELVQARDAAQEAAQVLRQTNVRLLEEAQQRQRSEEALRCSEERYALASRGANDGLWDWDLKHQHVYYSARWKAILGEPEDLVGDSPDEWFGRVHPEDLPALRRAIADHLEQDAEHFEHEHRLRHRDGEYRWVLARGLAVRDDEHHAIRFAGSLTDVTGRRHAEDSLRHQALHDTLTGLPNRAMLTERLHTCLQRARAEDDYCFAVFFLDLDRFKLINDSLGHAAGDELLIQFAQRLRTSLRAGDTVSRRSDSAIARLGGDEFVVLLDNLRQADDVPRIAERLHASLYRPFQIGDHELFVTGSIGVVVGSGSYEEPADVLRDADMAMYRAKASGRNRFEIFSRDMHAEVLTRLRLENDLRRAHGAKQLRLIYQPIVNTSAGQVVGFEALVRWQHPEHGAISPNEFIPLAEETGLIVPIGAWVLRQACADLAKWRRDLPDAHNLTISVNLSKRQISEPGLVDVVRDALADSQLPGSALKLEITESVIMEASEQLTPILHELRELGCCLHMDDFGTGYSSLSCLHRFPLDVIKIDRAFVVNMADDPRYSAVVDAIVILAHNLGMQVTAEGVETRAQLAQALALECDYCQGYLFARPLEAVQVPELLTSQPAWLATTAAD